jgi:hypothetical protein
MDMAVTLILAGAFLALALFCGWRGARPFDPMKGPRMAPWSLLMMLSTAALLLLIVHLANLLGLSTGRR